MKRSLPAVLALVAFASGCSSPSLATTRTVAAQLQANYDSEVKPLALAGITSQVANGQIQPDTAVVLRETVEAHGRLIRQLANPDAPLTTGGTR